MLIGSFGCVGVSAAFGGTLVGDCKEWRFVSASVGRVSKGEALQRSCICGWNAHKLMDASRPIVDRKTGVMGLFARMLTPWVRFLGIMEHRLLAWVIMWMFYSLAGSKVAKLLTDRRGLRDAIESLNGLCLSFLLAS